MGSLRKPPVGTGPGCSLTPDLPRDARAEAKPKGPLEALPIIRVRTGSSFLRVMTAQTLEPDRLRKMSCSIFYQF